MNQVSKFEDLRKLSNIRRTFSQLRSENLNQTNISSIPMKKSSTENNIKRVKITEVPAFSASSKTFKIKSIRKNSLNPDQPAKKAINFSEKNEVKTCKPAEQQHPEKLDHSGQSAKKTPKTNEKCLQDENSNDFSLVFQPPNETILNKKNISDISGLNDLSCIEFRDESFEDHGESFRFLSQEKIPKFSEKTRDDFSDFHVEVVPALNETIVFQNQETMETSPKVEAFQSPLAKTVKNSPSRRKVFLVNDGNTSASLKTRKSSQNNQMLKRKSSKSKTFPVLEQRKSFCSLPKVMQNNSKSFKNPYLEGVNKRKRVIIIQQKDVEDWRSKQKSSIRVFS